jgi:alpha-D-xyloside xylohydrolase
VSGAERRRVRALVMAAAAAALGRIVVAGGKAGEGTPPPRPAGAGIPDRAAVPGSVAASAGVAGPLALAADTVSVRTELASLHFAAASGGIEFRVLDAAGAVTHRVHAPGLELDGTRQQAFTGAAAAARNAVLDVSLVVLGPRAVAVTWSTRDGSERTFELLLTSDDETAYYGTGERFNALNQRGYALPSITDDRYGNKGVGTHKPVPFFMSSRGFGIWIDTFEPGSLDLSATERFTSRLRFTGNSLRVVFLAGPAYTDILEAFTALTGRTPVPPPWAFGLWKSRDVHHNQDSVLVDVERLRRYAIPSSVLVLDSPWETGYNTFDVNREQFRDPESMFARIRELGFELALWLTPFVNDSNVIDMRGIAPVSPNFEEARPFLVKDSTGEVALSRWWKGRGGLVDFTDPAAIAWWHEQLRRTRVYGARAFKADDGEGNFVPDAVFADGSGARSMKNRYATLYDSVMQSYIDSELGGDGVLIVRTGYTGVQRFPIPWAGDNRGDFSFEDGLPSVILAGQNAAFSGMALWGSDIAGYAGRPDREVFVRWSQFGAFTPFMQVHMTSNLGPWDFGDEVLDIFRDFAALRMRLFPYLYDAVHEAARTGMPVMRPMALAFQDDPAAARHVFQYMYGPDLLVAPMYQPGTRRSVYLPAGRWVDHWTGEVHDGPVTIEAEAPLARMPLYVRAGAILPQLPDDVQTLVARHDDLAPDVVTIDERRVLEVWPGEAGSTATWDGVSAVLSAAADLATLRIETDRPRPLEVRLRGRVLQEVRVDGPGVEADVRTDAPARMTVISFPELSSHVTLQWRESRP